MTTDELNAIVKAVMDEMEKAGVDFDFKAETPQADDLVYVMRGTADKYLGITVKWQNLLDIIVKKATDAKDEAVSAKDIALQTLATIQGIESNVSSMKTSIETMKASIETSEANVTASETRVTQIKAEAEQTLAEATQTVAGKADKTYVDGELAKKADITYVDGKLATKADKSELAVERARIDSLSTLPEGSTTGDAELIDLRIGADGVTYENAGSAVRTQISDLKGDLIELSNTVNGEYYQYAFEWEVGQLDKGVDYDSTKYYRTKSGVYYEFTEPLTITVADGYTLTVERYSSEKVYSGRATLTINESPYIFPINISPYYRLQIKKNDGSLADATWLNGVTFESTLMSVGLVGRVEAIENQNTHILNGKIWVSFGDSITAGNNLLETETNWSDRVARDLGCTHVNCGVGSSRVAGNQSSAFHQDARLDAVKNANPDIVTILGGANDLVAGYSIGTADEFSKALKNKNKMTYLGAYSYIIENLLTWKPSLNIVILGMYYAWNDGKDYSETNTYTDFSNASKQLAEYYGLPFVDLHNLLGFNQFTMGEAPYNTYTRDKIHPNDKGCEKIASVVKAKFIELFN